MLRLFFRKRDVPETSPSPPADPVAEATAMHVLAEDGMVRLEEGFLVACRAGGSASRLRIGDVAQLSLHGHAGVTTPCVMALLARGIPVVYRTANGYYAGQSVDLSGSLTAVRRAHYAAAAEPSRRLALARAVVKAKLTNARTLLRRHEVGPIAVGRLGVLAREAEVAPDHGALFGIEGSGAALYFAALPEMIARDCRAAFPFEGRRRRPPPDPLNALLSYLYAILVGECAAAVLAAGLDPTVGFLHSERAGRPALALDLVEPLRALIADPLALGLINRGELAPDHFVREGVGVLLNDQGRRIVLRGLERRLGESDFRRRLAEEAHRLAGALRQGEGFVSAMVMA